MAAIAENTVPELGDVTLPLCDEDPVSDSSSSGEADGHDGDDVEEEQDSGASLDEWSAPPAAAEGGGGGDQKEESASAGPGDGRDARPAATGRHIDRAAHLAAESYLASVEVYEAAADSLRTAGDPAAAAFADYQRHKHQRRVRSLKTEWPCVLAIMSEFQAAQASACGRLAREHQEAHKRRRDIAPGGPGGRLQETRADRH